MDALPKVKLASGPEEKDEGSVDAIGIARAG
ncbi:hypothetical protein HD597_005327 [Nonomuraea thailandensis]|uniref:Uncharacterized protein n=1 Tax=Nonomuraea thailandensis TaxID=1188745 RepID=A0A9X2GGS2_9ACTN|nr:hypothetical protein [Nonomuraea thailandensis]